MTYQKNNRNTLRECVDHLRNEVRTCEGDDTHLTQPVSPSVLRRQLITLASVYERADAYNRAALEPYIRRAWDRAEESRT